MKRGLSLTSTRGQHHLHRRFAPVVGRTAPLLRPPRLCVPLPRTRCVLLSPPSSPPNASTFAAYYYPTNPQLLTAGGAFAILSSLYVRSPRQQTVADGLSQRLLVRDPRIPPHEGVVHVPPARHPRFGTQGEGALDSFSYAGLVPSNEYPGAHVVLCGD